MFTNTKQSVTQTILFFVFFLFFLKSETPVIILTLFIILCSYPIEAFLLILNKEPKPGGENKLSNQWPTIIVLLILQLLTVCILGLIVWLFIDRKLDILKSILS